MAKPELGRKHQCQNCGAKFYDFLEREPVWPNCETTAEIRGNPKRRAKIEPEKPAATEAAKPEDQADTDEVDELIDGDLEIDDDDDEFVGLDDDEDDENLEAIVVEDKKGPKIEDD